MFGARGEIPASHKAGLKSAASSNWATRARRISDFELRISDLNWWTRHDLNVRPRPSQSRALIPLSYRSGISGGERAVLTATSAVARSHHRNLAEAAGVEPAHAVRGDLANRCHTVRRRLRRLAEGTGLEPASDKCAVVFKTTALPVRLPFQRKTIFGLCSLDFACQI